MKRIFFKTFGCRTNQFDTQIMIEKLKYCNITKKEEDADFIIVNSCSVTNSAYKGVKSYINRVKKLNEKKIIVTGCISNRDDIEDKLFGILGHSEKENIHKLIEKDKPFFELGNLNFKDTTIINDFVGKTRAFIKIQEGCNFNCSYCIIPTLRGRARSIDESIILKQIKTLVDKGVEEFILTGTNSGSYGKDSGSSLAKLILKLSKIEGLKRLRLGSLEPSQINREFLDILNLDFLAKHLHIAIQHSSNRMLKIMNRENRFEKDLELFSILQEKDFAIGTDFIVGHPFETEEIWEEAIDNIKKLPLTHIHQFTYSKRDGTKSAKMCSLVDKNVAKERFNQLKELIKIKNREFKLSIDKPLKVLIEQRKDNYLFGLDQYFNRVKIKTDDTNLKSGSWIEIKDFYLQDEFINYENLNIT